jgi:hypothetical protein
MPNKALLPLADGKTIVIESSIAMLQSAGCQRLVMVVSPGPNVLKEILWKREHQDIEYVVQPAPFGVADAISRAAPLCPHGSIVAFSDNVYGELRALPNPLGPAAPAAPAATTVSARLDQPHLDYYNRHEKQWKARPAPKGSDVMAGFLLLRQEDMTRGLPDMGMTSFLNRIHAAQIPLPCKSWADVGTFDSYARYLGLETSDGDDTCE